MNVKKLCLELVCCETEREALNKILKEDFGRTWDASDAGINTQRADLIARMFELRLIDRDKKGVKVTYGLIFAGETFLKS